MAAINYKEQIRSFVHEKGDKDFVKVNDFLKSLFPVPKQNEVPAWKNQQVSKQIRNAINDLRDTGDIELRNADHEKLGKFYYIENNSVTQHHDINSVDIFAKK